MRADEEQLVDTYLADIARRLPGPRRARRDVVDELRDGLLEAVDRHRERGVAPRAAVRCAIGEFGTPTEVAAAHAAELGVRQVRRCARRVLVLLVLAGLAWYGYDALLGTPASIVPPSGASRQVFLAATDVISYPPVVAALGALGLLVSTAGVRCARRLVPWSVVITTALGAHVVAMAAIMATGGAVLWTGTRLPVTAVLAVLVGWAFGESLRAGAAGYGT